MAGRPRRTVRKVVIHTVCESDESSDEEMEEEEEEEEAEAMAELGKLRGRRSSAEIFIYIYRPYNSQ